jgi:hypothetical protein
MNYYMKTQKQQCTDIQQWGTYTQVSQNEEEH